MAGPFLSRLFLALSDFRSPLLGTLVPCVAAAAALQAAAAFPSVAAQTERFYDLSGSLTFLAVGALSLYAPTLRLRALSSVAGGLKAAWSSLLASFTASAGPAAFNWRQVVLTGAMTVWALRLGSYLFQRVLKEGKDSRFDELKKSPKFFMAFFGQTLWVLLCSMPVLAVNAVPAGVLDTVPRILPTDVLGLAIWVAGFVTEVAADRQKSLWVHGKRTKQHDEEFLTKGLFSKCRFPNYFGEITLWTGLATVAAGTLARRPVQMALGFSGGPLGILTTTALAFMSPAFSSLLLLKVSGVPLSEKKYDMRYGDRKEYKEWKKNTPRLIPKIW